MSQENKYELCDNVYIGIGNLDGKGVYANRNIRKGDIVIKYNLKHLSKSDYNNLEESEKEFVHIHSGRFFLYSSPERYVNHSNSPNTYQDHNIGADIALIDINEGDFITCNSSNDNF